MVDSSLRDFPGTTLKIKLIPEICWPGLGHPGTAASLGKSKQAR